ncbi:beta-1,3-galactosyltransferase 5-like [Euwallacea similis]|uniref:beta-1,3-galactosyltransferase 5-like n=1 Tax=Euwallacea similis TaxID=1736056 RepID=UPI0034504274
MKGRTLPKMFYLMCVILFLVILFFKMLTFEEAEVSGWEFNVSRDLNDYIHKDKETATIMPKDFCDKPSFLLIICISSPAGFKARRVIRNTWGRDKRIMSHSVSLYFLLGQTTDLDVQKNITKESFENKDIVQENFYDSYNNLTLKSAMMLKLFTLRCQSKVNYLLKIDDDIYLNLPKLVDDLLMRNQTENLLMGSVICRSRPIRTYGDKWYAGPSYLFPFDVYPSYISGTTYCMSGDVTHKLLQAALTTPIFHLEDVYLTGICAKKIALNLTHNARFTFHDLKRNYCLFRQLITIHYQDPESIQKDFDASQDRQVDKRCQTEDGTFLVHKWLMENVFTISKTRRKHCP